MAPIPAPELIELLQQRIGKSPFLGWLGLQLSKWEPPIVGMTLAWRNEFVATPELGGVNGGIIATVLDCAASYAVIAHTSKLFVTADLRIDYHGRAVAGPLRAEGRYLRIGRTLATSDATLFDADGCMVASARGTFIGRDVPILQEKQPHE